MSSFEYGGFGTSAFNAMGRSFDNPFLLPSSETMPDNLETALDLCLFLYYLNPQYRAASARVVRHFITDFDYPGAGSQREKDDFDKFLKESLKLTQFFADVGDEFNCYGNAFARIHFPFDRFLIDPRGRREYALSMFGDRAVYNHRDLTYRVPDPMNPGNQVSLKFRDRKSLDMSRIRLRLLNPRYITIQHNMISGTSRFIYRFEQEIMDDVTKGRLHVVNETPLEMLRAVSNRQDFKFSTDSIFHFKAPTVSGVSNYGWGMPGVIASYRDLHQIQVYRKIDEAVGLDYMLPFRLFSPASSDQINDVIQNLVLSRWTGEIRKIIKNRRRDKFAMHSLPFPVNYQEFGAEGKNLTPKDLIEYQTANMLDGMCYPQELFRGSLQFLQVPNAMRLFENSFIHIYLGFLNLAKWVTRKVRGYMNLQPMEIVLQRPGLADSLERKQLLFQLASMGEISRETGYDALGIDNVSDEITKRFEEDAEIERKRFKIQQQMQKEMETGVIATPEEGDPNAGGNLPGGGQVVQAQPGSMTPQDVQSDADQLAQYWLSIPSDGERSKAMQQVKVQNEQLYALAKELMERYRAQGASQGRQMINQQAQQQGVQTV